MSGSWYVYKKNNRLGPMTSIEVRDALRDGTIDPMDLVSRVGSSVKIELYEVDEIFAVTNGQPITVTETHDAPIPLASGDFQNPVIAQNKRTAKSPVAPKPLIKGRSRRKRDPKKFFLIDRKKRRLGPLSAKEIQSIFYRGIVDQSAKVVKAGTEKKVPVGTFVNVYAGARAAEFKNEGTESGFDAYSQTSVAIPSTRVLDEMKRIRDHRSGAGTFTQIVLPILGILFGIALGYWAIDKYVVKNENAGLFPSSHSPSQEAPNIPAPQSRKPQQKVKSQKKSVKKSPPKKTAKKKQPTRKAVQKPKKKTPARVTRPTPRKTAPRTSALTRPTPAPRVSRPSPVVRKPQTKPKPKGAVASLRSGAVGTARGMRFSKSALASCGMRCTLVMTDSAGQSLRVVFFKGAYEDRLKNSSGRVTVTGRVSGSGNSKKMFLSNVQ